MGGIQCHCIGTHRGGENIDWGNGATYCLSTTVQDGDIYNTTQGIVQSKIYGIVTNIWEESYRFVDGRYIHQ